MKRGGRELVVVLALLAVMSMAAGWLLLEPLDHGPVMAHVQMTAGNSEAARSIEPAAANPVGDTTPPTQAPAVPESDLTAEPDTTIDIEPYSLDSSGPPERVVLRWYTQQAIPGDEEVLDSESLNSLSLLLLSYSQSGYDHREPTVYRSNVRARLQRLLNAQQADGRFSAGAHMDVRQHVFAAFALIEMYGLSGDSKLREPVEKAVRWLVDARTPGSGWGILRQDGRPDIITTALARLALNRYSMYEDATDYADGWRGCVDLTRFAESLVTERDGQLSVAYSHYSRIAVGLDHRLVSHDLPICEAAYILVRALSGKDCAECERVKALTKRLIAPENLPAWEEGRVDLMHWYLASAALFSVGPEAFKTWGEAMLPALLDNQVGYTHDDKRTDWTRIANFGSWPATHGWTASPSKETSTALAALCLEWYYGYLRMYG